MTRDVRLRITPLQAVSLLTLMPLLAAFVLVKTAVLRLFLALTPARPAEPRDPGHWDVVCISHVNWRHIWQRNHHAMAQLARHSNVLYVNPIRLDAYCKHVPRYIFLRSKRVHHNVWHHESFVLPFETKSPLAVRLNRWMLETRIRYLMRRLGFGSVVLWFYFPSQRWMVGRLDERAVVYDIQDEYTQFRWAPRDTAEKETLLLAEADVVFAGTDALYERKRPHTPNIHFFACGVDFDHFSRTYMTERPHEMRDLRGEKTLGYFGLIDERIDRDLLLFLARERPHWNLVMIGPIDRAAFQIFPAANVVFTGARTYAQLPRFLSHFDACLMPFADNELTRHINPTKALEYFASGKPVVSSPIPDMVKHYSDVIYFGATHKEFLAQCEACLADYPSARREQALQIARARSWDVVVGNMRRLISEAIARRENRPPP
jgi:glycosyltransferase involved in cell wall biosynthesis